MISERKKAGKAIDFETARKRFEEARCFFCGKESVGALYFMRKKKNKVFPYQTPEKSKSFPRWRLAYHFCELHHSKKTEHPGTWQLKFIEKMEVRGEVEFIW